MWSLILEEVSFGFFLWRPKDSQRARRFSELKHHVRVFFKTSLALYLLMSHWSSPQSVWERTIKGTDTGKCDMLQAGTLNDLPQDVKMIEGLE